MRCHRARIAVKDFYCDVAAVLIWRRLSPTDCRRIGRQALDGGSTAVDRAVAAPPPSCPTAWSR